MLREMYALVTPAANCGKLRELINKAIGKIASILYIVYCNCTSHGIHRVKPEKECNDVVVSLTTFPKRIEQSYYCIRSLIRQDYIPERVVLWLAKSEFPNGIESVPRRIRDLCKLGLDIRFCENIRSYKKFYYSAKEFKDKIIVTSDDDVLYPEDWLKGLYNRHLILPNDVICYRAHKINVIDGKVQPYSKWISLAPNEAGPSKELIAIGVGGILYPKGFFKNLQVKADEIMSIAPYSDDIFLKAFECSEGRRVAKVSNNNKELFLILGTQKERLTKVNIEEGNNNDHAMVSTMKSFNLTVQDFMD